MPDEDVLELDFRLGGNSSLYCGEGWLAPETGHRWSLGPLSELHFRDLPEKATYALVFTATPFGGPQRVLVEANDRHICEINVNGSEAFGCLVPGNILSANAGLKVSLRQPDARAVRDVFHQPDDRLLGIAAVKLKVIGVDWTASSSAETDIPIRELMLGFENLGDNCEFGIVQRRCGAEPLGLFRFSATKIAALSGGVDNGFAGIADRDNLLLQLNDSVLEGPQEYLFHQTKYGLIYHTFVFKGQMSFDALFSREQRKLAFLHGKFLEDLADARKIFVLKQNVALEESAVVPLWHALRRHGPNTLLWVVPADPAHQAGTVEVRCDGLLKGYIDRFAPYEEATNISLECWITLCRNAVAARRYMNAGQVVGHAAIDPAPVLG
jgi:hypothetical protein